MEMMQSMLAEWLLRETASNGTQTSAETRVALGTELGIVRTENQDKAAVAEFEYSGEPVILAVLSDGMGGLEDGGVCAALAISTFIHSCTNQVCKTLSDLILHAAHVANEAVFRLYQGNGGATLSAVICSSDKIYGLNVGDSRIYQSNAGVLKQLSTDDTLAGQFARQHESEPSEAGLLQFIGSGDSLSPHLIEIDDFDQGLLITSDGVHYLPRQTLSNIIKLAPTPTAAVRRLLAVSNWCGGHDNASAIFIPRNFRLSNSKMRGLARVWDGFGEFAFSAESEHVESKLRRSKLKSDEYEKAEYMRSSDKATKNKAKKKIKINPKPQNKSSKDAGPELRVDLFGEDS